MISFALWTRRLWPYVVGLLLFAGAVRAIIAQHDARVVAEARAADAWRHVDSVDAAVIPRERALHDTLAQLRLAWRRDSTSWMGAVAQWVAFAHPAPRVVRVDTLPGRIDTVFASVVPALPDVVAAGNRLQAACTAAIASCATRAAALERDTTFKAQRIAALESARSVATSIAPRSCTVPTLAGAALGALGGYAAGRAGRIHLGALSLP